jgi:geranylgeranyl pyrophosphate synthase
MKVAPSIELDAQGAIVDAGALDAILELPVPLPPALWEDALLGPAREVLARPGKRFRARLVIAAWRIAGGRGAPPVALASAVEVLHAGSLIIDDIEDDGQMRRGRPALHRLVGVPLALNTGNWMYCWPAHLIEQAGLPPAIELAVHRDLQRCLVRSHHGQALDLALRVYAVRRADLPSAVAAISRLKTGSLLELAARLGARAAGGDDAVVAALGAFGAALGEGLQMLDDLGSIVSAARADKGAEDLGHARCTWPWAWLVDGACEVTWRDLTEQLRAVATGEPAGLAALTAALSSRVGDRGRAAASAHLSCALDRLRARVGDDAIADLSAEVARVEASYG